jgi:MATE family multidrug resistance protein
MATQDFLGHGKRIAAIATPIVLAQLAQMAMGVTDTVFLGTISPAALAAGGLGAQLFFTLMWTLQGILSGVPVLGARAIGAGENDNVPRIYSAGLMLTGFLSLLVFAALSETAPLLRLLNEPENLIADIGTYLNILRFAAPGTMLGLGLMRQLLPMLGEQKLLLLASPAAVLVNALLNAWFIHGGFYLPAMGLRGAALATTVTSLLLAASLAILLHTRRGMAHLVRPKRPSPRLMRKLLAIGLPVTITFTAEAGLFMMSSLLAGRFGTTSLAAHNIALSVATLTFMVPLGISQAGNILVAGYSGAQNPRAARGAGLCAIAMGVAFMALSAAAISFFAVPIGGFYYQAGALPAQIGLTASLLRIAAAFQLADGLQVVSAGVLRGLADTRVPMLLALTGYWVIGLPTGYHLAFSAGFGVRGLWFGFLAGLGCTGLALLARFLWQSRLRSA